MNDSLRLVGKRSLTVAVATATLLWTVGISALTPFSAQAAVPAAGSLVRGSLSTVYYVGSDAKRYAFPTLKTYNSWYADFSGVQVISDSELAAIPLAGNIVRRPGSYWIKIQSDAKTYAVTPQGQLRWIENEATASGLAGSDWNQFIQDEPDVFFTDYTIGASLTSPASAYNGALVSMSGSTYLVWNGAKRLVTSAGMTANRFQSRFVLDGSGITLSGLTAGSDVSGAESVLLDTAQLGGTAVTGGLSVSLASDTPASATIPAGAASVPFAKYKLMASSGSAKVTQLVFKLGGVGSAANIDQVYLYDGNTRITDGRSVNSSTREATFSGLTIDLSAGASKTLTLRADISDAPTGGDTASFSLVSASSVVSTASVSGSFPISGNTMTFSETAAGSVTIDKTGSISDPTLGQKGATIGKFTVEATDEDASLSQITLNVDNASDHSNYTLWKGSTKLATGTVSKDLVTFALTSPLLVQEGDTETLTLTADIGGSAGDDIAVTVEEEADVIATGSDYGFNLSATITGYSAAVCDDSGDDCSFSTIAGGELTFAFNGPSADDIQVDGNDEILMDFTITAENWVEVNNIGVGLHSDDFVEGLNDGTDNMITDITLRKADGSTWMGPEELDETGDDEDQWINFTDTQIMNSGESLNLLITVDVANDDTLDGEVYWASLDMDGSGTGSDGIEAQDVNGDDLAADDIVPGADITGHDMTVTVASLEANFVTPPTDASYVKGSSGITVAGVNFTAGSTSDMKVTDVTFSAEGDDDDSAFNGPTIDVGDHFSSCSIYDSQSGSLIDGPEGVDADDEVLFENFGWTVPAGESAKMLLKCNLSNTDIVSADNDAYAFDIISTDNITAEDEDGDEVVASIGDDNDNGGVTLITVTDVGSITATLDGSTPSASIVLGSSTGVEVAKYKFSAVNEAFNVDTLTLMNDGGDCAGGCDDAVANAVKISYQDKNGATKTKTGSFSGGEVTFDNLDMYVPTETTKTLTVSLDTNAVSLTGATSGDDLQIVLDVDTDFEATGVGSGEVDSDAGTDVEANLQVLHKTKPTLSLASGSPSGAGVPGDNSELLRFNVSADSRGYVTLESVLFSVSTSDTGDAWANCDDAWADAGEWEIYDIDDPSDKLDDAAADWAFIDDTGTACGAGVDLGYVEIDFAGGGTHVGEEIGAGTTKTYVLRGSTSGASVDPSDSIQLGIVDETEADTVTFSDRDNAITWDDDNVASTGGDNIDGTFVKNLPITGGAIVY